MVRTHLQRSLLMAVAAFALSAGAVAAQTKTVIVVRHAEKADDSADPVLSAEGEERARALVHALHGRNVGAIFTTQYQRTILTAAPLAEANGITHTVVAAAGGNHVADVATQVRSSAADLVVVVGHSNTVPAIVRALGGEDVGAIGDNEYGNIYEVTLSPDGVQTKRSWFGREKVVK